jgi:hypothetical protein
VCRQSIPSGGARINQNSFVKERRATKSPLKPPFFDNIDPKRTSAFTYYGAFARACRPRSVMMYSVFRSLCGCSVTYCTSTK